MAGNLVELTVADFDGQVKAGVTLVDFWAPWCGPCRMQAPILDKLAPKVAGKATIAKVNVDEAPEIAARYGVRSIPTLILFKDGQVVQQFVGVQPEAKLAAALETA
jgi:thioredoxin 1